MADVFTETTSQSWFSRLGSAFKGILVGLALFVLSFPLLFWNEGRAVKRYKTLKEGSEAVVSVSAENVDAANADKLVHVTGMADTEETLRDEEFGISAKALRMIREVEMYVWDEETETEEKKKLGGGTETVTTYTYDTEWSSTPVDSSRFSRPEGHENPTTFPYSRVEQEADLVTLGAFRLSPDLIQKIGNFEPAFLAEGEAMPEALEGKAQIDGDRFYLGDNPASPQVGDVRIGFKVAKPTDVSVIAVQREQSFVPYQAEAGGTIQLLQTGVHSAKEMFQAEHDANTMLTWLLRLAGFALMTFGLLMVLKPLSVLADVLPILGNVVGAGTFLIAILVALVGSLTTIAIAWLFYRPLLGITLIVVVGGLIWLIRAKLKKGSSEESAPLATEGAS